MQWLARDTHHVQLPGEERGATELGLGLVRSMVLEKFALVLECGGDGLVGFDIALTTVDDWDIPQTEGNNTTCENVDNIGSLVPIIQS